MKMPIARTVNFRDLDFIQRFDPNTVTRKDRLEVLMLYFLRHLVEDPQDGTLFDCDVMDAIRELQRKYDGKED